MAFKIFEPDKKIENLYSTVAEPMWSTGGNLTTFFTGSTGTGVADNTVLPSVAITIENAQSGDFFALSSITGSGFNIDIKNGSSHVNREFKYTATGFGRGA